MLPGMPIRRLYPTAATDPTEPLREIYLYFLVGDGRVLHGPVHGSGGRR